MAGLLAMGDPPDGWADCYHCEHQIDRPRAGWAGEVGRCTGC